MLQYKYLTIQQRGNIMTISTKELIALGDRLRDHFIKLGFRTSWDFYGNDVIIEIITDSNLREKSERLCFSSFDKDSTTITIWTEDGENHDKWSVFVDSDTGNRIFSPSEEDIKNVISHVEQVIF